MKKNLFLLLVAILLCCGITGFASEGERQFYIPGFDLTKAGADWGSSTVRTIYHEADGTTLGDRGWYELSPNTGRLIMNKTKFNLLPNRSYRISFLMKSDFNRDNCEVSIGFREYDKDGKTILENFVGVPSDWSTWKRFEGVITTSSRTVSGNICGSMYGFLLIDENGNPDPDNKFYISDLYVFELPEVSLSESRTEPGEGMVFGGSSGRYDMKITRAEDKDGKITVATDGAEYTFDKASNTITAKQLINQNREVFTAVSNKSFANLTIHSRSNNEAVLTTGEGGITIGVQMDGLALIANHGDDDLQITYTSSIDGKWNRLSQGNLMAKDDIGGFTVNPYIPMGTGRQARYQATGVDFDNKINDTDFISSSKAGWSVKYDITAGEMLGMSVFPPREYDWEESFNSTYSNYYTNGSTALFASDRANYGIDTAVLWDFTKRGWGMSWGNEYIPIDASHYQTHINAAQSSGMKALPYMSMYYWYNRDITEYLNEVKRHRDTYGIDGVYTDGLPDKEWLAAYKGARGLRELFPDGTLIFHTTGQIGNGGSPMAVPDISIPAIDAYASVTLRGEGVEGVGEAWEYPKNIAYGYNISNAIGLIKGDKWLEQAGGNLITQKRQTFLSLLGGGRARMVERANNETKENGEYTYRDYMNLYQAVLKEAEADWNEKGSVADYYNMRYLPLVQKRISNLPNTVISENRFIASAELDEWTVQAGNDTSVGIEFNAAETDPYRKNRLKINDFGNGSCVIKKSFTPTNKTMNLRVRFKADAAVSGEISALDSTGNRIAGIFICDGKLYMMDVYGGYSEIGNYEVNKWHTVTMVSDGIDGRYNILLDNEVIVKNKSFNRDSVMLSELMIKTGENSQGTLLIDDVLLEVKE